MIDHPKIRIAYIKRLGWGVTCFWRVFYPPTSCHARAVSLVPAFHPHSPPLETVLYDTTVSGTFCSTHRLIISGYVRTP